MQRPTPQPTQEKITRMTRELQNLLENLYCRWQDEKEYEDIKDYAEVIKKKLPEGFEMTQMLKSPFGFKFKMKEFDEALYQVAITSRHYSWKRIG